MTIKDVQEAVVFLEAISGDDEAAHSDEDALHRAVLAAIADGTAENPQEMARLAVETAHINFERWMA